MKIVKIGAMWCPACIAMNKYYNEIRNEYNNIIFEDLDIDSDEDEASKYGDTDILPVLIFLENGKEVRRIKGEKTKEQIKSFINGD